MRNFLTRLWARRTAMPLSHPEVISTKAALRVEYGLDQFWCDKYGMFFQGWILPLDLHLRRFIITIGEDSHEVTNFTPRADLLQFYPSQPDISRAGFVEFVPSRPGEKVFFTVETDIGSHTVPVQLPKLTLPPPQVDLDEHFLFFVNTVNEQGLTVMEIGSRVVGEESKDFRPYFSQARRYIGMDIHPSPTVDVVGDAHFLSQSVGISSVDAVFSFAVLEHLAYPWLFAKELNRVLTIGGLVFLHTVHTWPIHEQPNDFWRFSDEGLKVLFGPDTGFEVIHAGVSYPFYIYPDYRHGALAQVPLNPGFGVAKILTRKVRDIDPNSIAWPVKHGESQERSEQYPRKDNHADDDTPTPETKTHPES